jgi:hypothetical protein
MVPDIDHRHCPVFPYISAAHEARAGIEENVLAAADPHAVVARLEQKRSPRGFAGD